MNFIPREKCFKYKTRTMAQKYIEKWLKSHVFESQFYHSLLCEFGQIIFINPIFLYLWHNTTYLIWYFKYFVVQKHQVLIKYPLNK